MNAVLLIGVAVGALLMVPSSSAGRLLGLPGAERRTARPQAIDVACVAAGLGTVALIPGPLGFAAAVIVALAARAALRALPRTDSEREDVARQVPDAVDCLSACLAAGAPLWSAIPVVATAFGPPLAPVLQSWVHRHAMGAPMDEVFADLDAAPGLAAVGRILVRSSESGTALTAALMSCAEELREQRAAVLDRRARAVGVKAVGPLGLCFLPAFVLLAVVPIVGSMVQELL